MKNRRQARGSEKHNRRSYGIDLEILVVGSVFLCVPLGVIYLVGLSVADVSWATLVMQITRVCYIVAAVLIMGTAIWAFFSTKNRNRTCGTDSQLMVVGTVFVCIPFGIIYLVGWYVDDDSRANLVMQIALMCHTVAATLIIGTATLGFLITEDSRGFAEGAGAAFGFGMMIPVLFLILAILASLLLKWTILLFGSIRIVGVP